MGGTGGYARPVTPTDGRISTWKAHTNRNPASTEPGVDYYCPRGTPVVAAASGRVVDVGDSIAPATGRFVTIDLDDGRRARYLHLERRHVKVGDRVAWGQHIADSGATGYGEADWSWNVAQTGGAHVHMTLFRNYRYTFGRYATLDPEAYMAAYQGGNAVSGEPESIPLEDDNMILIESLPDRGRALIGAGTFCKINNSEELREASRIATKTLKGNARQFDVWKSLALRTGKKSDTVELTDAQLKEIAAAAREGGAEALKGLEFVITAG